MYTYMQLNIIKTTIYHQIIVLFKYNIVQQKVPYVIVSPLPVMVK